MQFTYSNKGYSMQNFCALIQEKGEIRNSFSTIKNNSTVLYVPHVSNTGYLAKDQFMKNTLNLFLVENITSRYLLCQVLFHGIYFRCLNVAHSFVCGCIFSVNFSRELVKAAELVFLVLEIDLNYGIFTSQQHTNKTKFSWDVRMLGRENYFPVLLLNCFLEFLWVFWGFFLCFS